MLEPHLVRFMSSQIEGVGTGITTPAEAKQNLEGVASFVSMCGGVHADISLTHGYYRFINLPDEVLLQVCREVVFKNFPEYNH